MIFINNKIVQIINEIYKIKYKYIIINNGNK
jgi:hypothetical protein